MVLNVSGSSFKVEGREDKHENGPCKKKGGGRKPITEYLYSKHKEEKGNLF